MKIPKKLLLTVFAIAVPSLGFVFLNRKNHDELDSRSLDLVDSPDTTVLEEAQNVPPDQNLDPKTTTNSNFSSDRNPQIVVPGSGQDSVSEYKASYSSQEFEREMKNGHVQARDFTVLNRDLISDVYINSLNPAQYLPDERPSTPTTIDKARGDKILETIHDYTVALVSSGCLRGTGWFLDYVIPKNGSYPTKGFIATNAHVVEANKFKGNPYNQSVPSAKDLCDSLFVLKDTSVGNKGGKKKSIGTNRVNANLFYVPTNYLGPRYFKENGEYKEQPYARDFAVLAIKFRNEGEARVMTDDFYYKYGPNGSKKENSIKFLNTPKESTHRHYFMGGYPGRDNYGNPIDGYKFSSSGYSKTPKTGSMITYKSMSYGGVNYDGKFHRLWGRDLDIGGIGLGPGSSGSLVVDENLNAIGVHAGGPSHSDIAQVETLRGHGTYTTGDPETGRDTGEKKMLFPRYDLLQGAYGQKGSYMQQLKKYFSNEKTYLLQEMEKMSQK